jgi:hypothetical protein
MHNRLKIYPLHTGCKGTDHQQLFHLSQVGHHAIKGDSEDTDELAMQQHLRHIMQVNLRQNKNMDVRDAKQCLAYHQWCKHAFTVVVNA